MPDPVAVTGITAYALANCLGRVGLGTIAIGETVLVRLLQAFLTAG